MHMPKYFNFFRKMIFRKKLDIFCLHFQVNWFFKQSLMFFFIILSISMNLVNWCQLRFFFPVWSPIRQDADLAVAGITITSAREKFVDFTKPFWNLGITILFRKPKPKPIRLFSFLDPFHEDVWVYMIAIYLCVSFMFFVIARLTPYEWCNPYPCNQ